MRSSVFLLGIMSLCLPACQNQSEHSQPRPPESSGVSHSIEQTPSQSGGLIPGSAETEAITALQDRVAQQPQEIAARRELGAKSLDVAAGVVWTVGQARLPGGPAAGAVVRNQAELAARLDASRWAAYLLEWQKNDYATAFGTLRGQVPASEVVHVAYTDSSCVVLLKTSLR